MLKIASAYAHSRLYSIKAQTLILCRFILFVIVHLISVTILNHKFFVNSAGSEVIESIGCKILY